MSIERKIASFKDYGIQLNLEFRYAKKNNYIKSNPMDEVVYPVLEEEHLAENSSEKIKCHYNNGYIHSCNKRK